MVDLFFKYIAIVQLSFHACRKFFLPLSFFLSTSANIGQTHASRTYSNNSFFSFSLSLGLISRPKTSGDDNFQSREYASKFPEHSKINKPGKPRRYPSICSFSSVSSRFRKQRFLYLNSIYKFHIFTSYDSNIYQIKLKCQAKIKSFYIKFEVIANSNLNIRNIFINGVDYVIPL